MDNLICEHCKGTGLVSLSTGPAPEPIAGFLLACSHCDAGHVIWLATLDLIDQVETEIRQLDLADLKEAVQGEANAQSRASPHSMSAQRSQSTEEQKRTSDKPSALTIRALRKGKEIDLNLKKLGDKDHD
jgi:hypothetical protein